MFGRKDTNLNERAPEEYSRSPRFGARSSDALGDRYGNDGYNGGYSGSPASNRGGYYEENRRDWDTDPRTRPGRWTSSATTTNFHDDSNFGQKEGLGSKMNRMLGRDRNSSRDYDSRDDSRRGGLLGRFRNNGGGSRSSRDYDDDDDDSNGTNWNIDFGGRGYQGPEYQGYQSGYASRKPNDWYFNQNADGCSDYDSQSCRPTAWDTRSFGRTNTFMGRNKSRQFNTGMQSQSSTFGSQPAVDIYEAGNEFIIEMDLPGYTRECVEMKLYGSELVITCNPSTANRVTSFLVNERTSTRQMKRTLHLPPSADSKRINAQLSNGVLKITIPKCAGTTIQPSGSSSLTDNLRGSNGATTGSTTNITRVGSSTATY